MKKKAISFNTNILPTDGSVYLFENYIQDDDHLFEKIVKETAWEQKDITLFGKTIPQPRLISWCSDPGVTYKYSGTEFKPCLWPKHLNKIRQNLNFDFKTSFNSVLLNYYRDGTDSMGLHSDDEKVLGKNPTVASISFGAERLFKFSHKTESHRERILLKPGSLLLMTGSTQHFWKHELPKLKKIHKPRLNLTFRNIKN